MNKKTIITALLAIAAMTGLAQTSFDAEEGCLNVVDVSYARGVGEYGDGCLSANYTHERFINELGCKVLDVFHKKNGDVF